MKLNYLLKFLLTNLLLSSLLLTGCSSELKKAIDNNDATKIIDLYNAAKNNKQREEICKQINEYSFAWIKELVKYNDKNNTMPSTQLYSASKENLLAYSKKLKFLESIKDENLMHLLVVKRNIDLLLDNANTLDNDFPDKSELTVYDNNHIENLSVYVNRRFENSGYNKITNVGVDKKHLDDYLVSSYRIVYSMDFYNSDDLILPNDKWEGIVYFQESTIVEEGVMKFRAIQIGEEKIQDTEGFKKTLPLYVEVSERDMAYTDFMLNTYNPERENCIVNIQKVIMRYENGGKTKTTNVSSKEKATNEKNISNEEKMLYGTWDIIDDNGNIPADSKTMFINKDNYTDENGKFSMHSVNIKYDKKINKYSFSFIIEENAQPMTVKGYLYKDKGEIYMIYDLGYESVFYKKR